MKDGKQQIAKKRETCTKFDPERTQPMEKKSLIYDLPTRLFHWIFVGLLLVAGTISQTVDDDSGVFGYHMICGMVLTLAIFLRIIWGFGGTRYARFSSFALKPKELIDYFKNILNPTGTTWRGHNPASSWSALAMMALGLGLGFSGFAMVNGGDKFSIGELHELMAYGLLAVVLMHIGGLLLHTFIHRDQLITSMFTGFKKAQHGETSPIKVHGGFAFLGLTIVAGIFYHLWSNYEVSSGILSIFGNKISLIEDVDSSSEDEDGEREDND
jgi:cytochrome b